MIPIVSRDEVRAFDVDAVERLGVPSMVLMENAGAAATRILLERCAGALDRVLVVGGVGQNGGDAWVVARKLLTAGIVPRCMLLGPRDRVTGDAATNLRALLKLGLAVESLTEEADLLALNGAAAGATLCVDGVVGTGLDRPLTGLHAAAVAQLNASPGLRFALDLPSGIDADTGQVLGAAVCAGVTVTFAAHKRGLHQYPGTFHAGELHCVDIGVPVTPRGEAFLVEPGDFARSLRARAPDAHKGSHGHVVLFAGSPGKTGAALLSALGSLRAGAGLVTVATDPRTREVLDSRVIEVMTAALDPGNLLQTAMELAQGKTAAVLGPGLGLDEATRALSLNLARALPMPCVIDADALTALAGDVTAVRDARGPRILTPHPGEAARLLGCETRAVQADRYGAAAELARLSGQTVVLKGARTIVAAAGAPLLVCGAGTPALGVAGTGDVLAGILGALSCHAAPFEAAWQGVMLHALAAERAAAADRGLLAHEVATAVPQVLAAQLRSRG